MAEFINQKPKIKRTHYKICVFGDSVTYAGYVKNNWYSLLRNHLESLDELNIELFNLGINGNSSRDILSRFDSEAIARDPNKIIFAFGVNDSAYILSTGEAITSTQDFQENISKLIKSARIFTNDITFI